MVIIIASDNPAKKKMYGRFILRFLRKSVDSNAGGGAEGFKYHRGRRRQFKKLGAIKNVSSVFWCVFSLHIGRIDVREMELS